MAKKQNRALAALGSVNLDEKKEANATSDELQAEIRRLRQELAQVGDNSELKTQIVELEQELEALGKSIIRIDDHHWRFLRFEMTPVDLTIPDSVTQEELEALGYALSGLDTAIQFWIGKWANTIVQDVVDDNERGRLYNELADHFGYSRRSIKNYASVERNLRVSLRRDTLSFTIHRMVAECSEKLKGREFELIEWADKNQPSTRQFAEYMNTLVKDTSIPKAKVTNDSFLFSKDRKPKINQLQASWSKARNGDSDALKIAQDEISKIRKWLNDLEDSLTE
ncbi:MAG: hypothetical protein AAFV93_09555 [Chloroflexota bacterium]